MYIQYEYTIPSKRYAIYSIEIGFHYAIQIPDVHLIERAAQSRVAEGGRGLQSECKPNERTLDWNMCKVPVVLLGNGDVKKVQHSSLEFAAVEFEGFGSDPVRTPPQSDLD